MPECGGVLAQRARYNKTPSLNRGRMENRREIRYFYSCNRPFSITVI